MRDLGIKTPGDDYKAALALNRELLKENTELKLKITYLQKELAKAKEANK